MGLRSKKEPELGERVWHGLKDSTDEEALLSTGTRRCCAEVRVEVVKRARRRMERRGRGRRLNFMVMRVSSERA